MTELDKVEIIKLLDKKLEAQLANEEDSFSQSMLRAEHRKNMEKVEEGINPFDKPEQSDYICEGCGA